MNKTKLKTSFRNKSKIDRKGLLPIITAILLSAVVLGEAPTSILALSPEVTQPKLDDVSELLLAETEDLITATPAQVSSTFLSSGVRQTVLENGLTILTKEVHTAPVVSVQVWYRVGFINEAPEQKGIAHLLEHMLFRGTKERPIQFGQLFTALNSNFNAFIDHEYTSYHHTIAPHKLKALLTLEADRMQNTLITSEDLAQEKQILLTELQGQENNPYYRLYQALLQAQFPHGLYSQTVTEADLDKITVEQVRDFYHQYYRPSNASIVIVGDFQTEALLQDIQTIFGAMTQPEEISTIQAVKPKHKIASPASTSPLPVVLREAVGLPTIAFIYPLPERNHPDIPALIVMDYILDYGVSSYLSRALVNSGVASSARAQTTLLSEEGWYLILATANSEQKLNRVEQIVAQLIMHLQTQGVSTKQLNRAKAQIRGATILGHRTVANQAYRIGYDLTISRDYGYTDRLLEAISQVTVEDVQRVARQYLSSKQRTVGRLEPTQAKEPGSNIQLADWNLDSDFSPREPLLVAEVAKYLPPFPAANNQQQAIPVPQQFMLPNGLQVLLLPDSSTPSVSLRVYLRAGNEFDPPEQLGLAVLTASNLLSGPMWLLQEFEGRGGTGLNSFCDAEGVYLYGVSLAKDLPFLLETLADTLQYPTFPAESLEITRQNYLKLIQVSAKDRSTIAQQAFVEAIYPENHPLRQVPSEVTLKAISRKDVVEFYRQHYRPDNTVLVLVGNFNISQIRKHLEAIFGNWQASDEPTVAQWPDALIPDKVMRLSKPLSTSTQSLTLMGYPILELTPEELYAAKVLNEILGGNSISSRLGNELRYNQGLTYTIRSHFESKLHSTLFYISMETAPENSTAAIARVLAVLRQVQEEGVSHTEVEIAKQSLISQYQIALADPDILTIIILFDRVYGYSREEIRLELAKLQAVTTQQVNQVANKLLRPEQIAIVTVGGGR